MITRKQEILLNKTLQECLNILTSCRLQDPTKLVDLSFDLSTRMNRSLGKTVFDAWNPDGSLKKAHIVFQQGLCDSRFARDLQHVMLHELVHVLYPRDGHGSAFQSAGALIKAHYPSLDVQRLYVDTEHEYQPAARERKIRYRVQCPACGHVWEYERMSNCVKHPEDYSCGKCKRPLVRIQ